MNQIWINFLRLFAIVQFRNIENSKYSDVRLNPWNPLSYIIILLFAIIYIFRFGIQGFKEKININKSPFKWEKE